MTSELRSLLVAAAALIALPLFMLAIGLTLTSATDVVIFAIAAMALNILVGHTGLVSFGHGAFFGVGAYAAVLAQRHALAGQMLLPVLFAVLFVAFAAAIAGLVILRRRGVYFSLLTLALTAVMYTISFRWTELTGGENGLGGVVRPNYGPVDLNHGWTFYGLVALLGFVVVLVLQRFHNAPVGSVLVAIRENETRARFVGYDTDRYKLIAFTVSAALTGFAGALSAFHHRFTSADPVAIQFSGELLAMVVIGGMRSFLGPALGALFFMLSREYLSLFTSSWLLFFGLMFVGFIVFSPTGLTGVAQRLLAPFRRLPETDAAMAGRRVEAVGPVPREFVHEGSGAGPVLCADGIVKSFGGIRAVRGVSFTVMDRTLHALIGPNGAGKTTAFNLLSGMFPPDSGTVTLDGRPIGGLSPQAITAAGVGRSFQITNLFGGLTIEENVRLAIQARHSGRFGVWTRAAALPGVAADTTALMRYLGLAGIEKAEAGSLSYGGQRLVDMALALATRPRVLLLDEPLAGLAAAERRRVGDIIKTISADIPVLLVEHDIDRVFQIADHVTVMNDGEVLIDGTVEEARSSEKVQAVYLGSGTHAITAKERPSAATETPLLMMNGVNTFYGKSHILNDVSVAVAEGEIVALLGRNGAGKSTLLKTITGIAPPASGSILLAGEALAGLSSDRIARRGVGYVPQGRGLFAGMPVKDNLMLGRLKRLTGAGRHWDEDKVLSFFPRLKERWNTPADFLSGGEQQMVAVARALVGDTRILLLDEPFEGLSPAITEELFEAFDKLRREVSIIIVDHHLDLALALSDRTVALERGTVTWSGASKSLRDDQDLRRKVLWL
ncbi:branched-chain amino acid ABC transporter ATP-binding protein/permease [Phreatobacter sp. AB_2022a]|uniref:branched-chain amino acid ABC transporter ATP-binding protein/permease n=1 Tax=Phreatobacter sp. AB_2022a TaxID=3003134 RepID=UPI002286DE4D|nr:branched-chain amino acid ABC transporter ATP-binding protein/permease [Phreatobacter sp. AB_2022a]MCZ0737858.1 branched-chain amino acid ABC transporter ATP-binding protein/permease [Phreatobacter sp. AB_2022a]